MDPRQDKQFDDQKLPKSANAEKDDQGKKDASSAEMLLSRQLVMTKKLPKAYDGIGAAALKGYVVDFIEAAFDKLYIKRQKHVSSITEKINDLAGRIDKGDSLSAELQKQKKLLEDELKFYEDKVAIAQKFHDALKERLAFDIKRFEHIKAIGDYQYNMDEVDKYSKALDKALKEQDAMLSGIAPGRLALSNHEDELKALQGKKDAMDNELKNLQEKLSALYEQNKADIDTADSLMRDKQRHFQFEYTGSARVLDALQEKLKEYYAIKRSSEARIKEIKNALEQGKDSIQQQISKLEELISEKKKTLSGPEYDLERLKLSIKELSTQLNRLQSDKIKMGDDAINAINEDAALQSQFVEYINNLDKFGQAAEDFYGRLLATYLLFASDGRYSAVQFYKSAYYLFNRIEEMGYRYSMPHEGGIATYRFHDFAFNKLQDMGWIGIIVDRFKKLISAGHYIIMHEPFSFPEFSDAQALPAEKLFELFLLYYAKIEGEIPEFLHEVAQKYGINPSDFGFNTVPFIEESIIHQASDQMTAKTIYDEYISNHPECLQLNAVGDLQTIDEIAASLDPKEGASTAQADNAESISNQVHEDGDFSTSASSASPSTTPMTVQEIDAQAHAQQQAQHVSSVDADEDEEEPDDIGANSDVSGELLVNPLSNGNSQALAHSMHAVALVSLESHAAHHGNFVENHPYLMTLIGIGLGAAAMQIWEMSQDDAGLMHDIYGWLGLGLDH